MRKITLAMLVCSVLLPVSVLAKGEGVALWMEGRVADVQAEGPTIHLLLTGRFWFEQHRGATRSIVEVDGQRGLPVTVTQAQPFFAMTTDWRGGAIRDQGALLVILRAAAQRQSSVKFELLDAQLAFGRDNSFTVVSGGVVRATDHELR